MAFANFIPSFSQPSLAIRARQQIIDKGFNEIRKTIGQLDGMVIKVGILSKDANEKYPSGATLGAVAHQNEFGASVKVGKGIIHIPQRSFERAAFDQMNKNWFRAIQKYMGKQNVRQTLNRRVAVFAGRMMQKEVRKRIALMRRPRNAPRTVANKGFDDPLILTGNMWKKIDIEIKKGKL